MLYQGIIIAEALKEPWAINQLHIEEAKISKENNYHLYGVRIHLNDIGQVISSLKNNWFLHFWNDSTILVVFGEGKQFFLDRQDQNTWVNAITYGLQRGFSEKSLDFSPYSL